MSEDQNAMPVDILAIAASVRERMPSVLDADGDKAHINPTVEHAQLFGHLFGLPLA